MISNNVISKITNKNLPMHKKSKKEPKSPCYVYLNNPLKREEENKVTGFLIRTCMYEKPSKCHLPFKVYSILTARIRACKARPEHIIIN